MKNLKKAIAKLEKEIATRNAHINKEYSLLKNRTHLPNYIYLGIAGSFILGFLLVRSKNRRQLLRDLSRMAFKANNIYRNVKLFL